jgi:hypothetical protein
MNLFIVRDGVIMTPPTMASILPGITRDSIMTVAKELKMPVVETNMQRENVVLWPTRFSSLVLPPKLLLSALVDKVVHRYRYAR